MPDARWSVLVAVDGLSKEGRAALFDAVCQAVTPFENERIQVDVSGQPCDELGAAMSVSTEPASTTPRAGDRVIVTRPDGVTYWALLQRYDGPHGGIAVLYTEPVDAPDDAAMYEHSVYVAEGISTPDAPVCSLAPDAS